MSAKALSVPTQLSSVTFKVYSSEEIKRLSVLEVTNEKTFDSLGHATSKGLCDYALGPVDRSDVCTTCGGNFTDCNGHYGHINLSVPVFNPFLIRHLFQIIKLSCLKCHRLLFSPIALETVLSQLRAIELGFDYLVDELQEIATVMLNNEFNNNVEETSINIAKKLADRIEDECQALGIDKNTTTTKVKNVVEKQYRIFRDLTQGKLIKTLKVCHSCASRKQGMDIVTNSTIVLKSSKRAINTGVVNNEVNESNLNVDGNSFFTPLEAKNHMREMWKNEHRALKTIFRFMNCLTNEEHPTDIFFYDAILVSPNKFRPLMFMKGRKYENARTTLLQSIMLFNSTIKNLTTAVKESLTKEEKIENVTKLHRVWQRMQIFCNRLYDSELDKIQEKRPPGVKQIIEKKEGLFRKHMMGKRVNYAARSVILPDPYIMVDEVGIPMVFAEKLTFPQPVNAWNVKQMRKAILNGPLVYPGATTVIMADGACIRLKPNDEKQRNTIANMLGMSGDFKVKIVNRHLVSGDVLLLNRQPTLHKPSMMAHRARVLKGEKTMRLHYANCKSYNADFDGDEMNAHFPQSELARAEAYNIASVNRQLLVPKDGTPLSGLIQDHIVASALMTIRGMFFTREDYHELVFGSISFTDRKIKTLMPAIVKPVPLWSGKQIVSTIILNVIPEEKPAPTLTISSKIRPNVLRNSRPNIWREGSTPLQDNEMCESEVIIRNGELLCGILDKANIGSTPYGIVHCCYELYGGKVSTALMTAFARLSNNYLQICSGLTLGIADILVNDEENEKRKRLIKKSLEVGKVATARALNVKDYNDKDLLTDKFREAHSSRNPLGLKLIDNSMKSETDDINNKISKVCLDGLLKPFPSNNLQLMIKSGAKGGTVNALQISCLMGQIELEGRRVPLMMSGRTLPSFIPYDASPRSGGFVTGRFLTGIRPQEYFFHCMAGREGLIDTAVKTSQSGYLQRCLIKHLEGLVVNYDLTVRDSDGSVIQFLYGEDGLDVSKSQLLKKDGFPLLCANYKSLKPSDTEMTLLSQNVDNMKLEELQRMIKKWIKVNGADRLHRRHGSAFQDYFVEMAKECKRQCEKNDVKFGVDDYKKIIHTWFELDEKDRNKINKYWKPCPGPLISELRPDLNYGVVSETIETLRSDFMEDLENSGYFKKPESEPEPREGLSADHSEPLGQKENDNSDNGNRSVAKVDSRKEGKSTLISKEEFENMVNVLYMKYLCEPGEAVGLLAAQSIGEPSTQMTLNTFHFAGRGEMNVTLGIPRLREILMTASPNIATPSMDIPLLYNEEADMDEIAENLRLQLNSVKLSDVLERVIVTETVVVSEKGCSRVYKIKFHFLPRKLYKNKVIANAARILQYMETKFFKSLVQAIKVKLDYLAKYNSFYEHSLHARPKKNAGNEDEDDEEPKNDDTSTNKISDEQESSDEEQGDEIDATALKSKLRHNQDLDYEEPEEVEIEEESGDEVEVLDVENDNNSGSQFVSNHEPTGSAEGSEEIELVLNNQKKKSKNSREKIEKLIAQKPERVNKVLSTHPAILDYDFDTRREEWCEIQLRYSLDRSKLDMGSIVEQEAKNACIYKVGRIEKAFIVKDPDAAKRGLSFDKMIKTEGVSFLNLVKFSHLLDLKRTRSNDIHAVARTFGIEAARRALQIEITNVFAVYGIRVDPRHLSLVSDYMTFDGTVKGMNRMSMTSNSSPLQQMSFETTTAFLKTAVLLAHRDDMNSPSAKIFAGRPAGVGTGLFSIRAQKVNPSAIVQNQTKAFPGRWSGKKRQRSSSKSPYNSTPRDGSQYRKRSLFGSAQTTSVNKRIKFD